MSLPHPVSPPPGEGLCQECQHIVGHVSRYDVHFAYRCEVQTTDAESIDEEME